MSVDAGAWVMEPAVDIALQAERAAEREDIFERYGQTFEQWFASRTLERNAAEYVAENGDDDDDDEDVVVLEYFRP